MRNWLVGLWRLRSPTVCHLPCASWRPRKDSGVIQYRREGLRTREADGTDPSLRAREKMLCPSSSSEVRKGVNSCSLHHLFHSGPQQTGWCLSALERAICFMESADSIANPIQKHPHRHTQKQCLIWAPYGQSSCRIKFIIAPPTQKHPFCLFRSMGEESWNNLYRKDGTVTTICPNDGDAN